MTRHTRQTLAVIAACGALAIVALTAYASRDDDRHADAPRWAVNQIHAAEGGE